MSEIQPQVLRTLRPDATLQKINQGRRRTHSFKVDYRELNEDFVGTFVIHYPSQMEKLQMGVIKSQLLGGVPAIDTMTDNIAEIVSTLDIVIDRKPEWFDVFDDLLEYEVLEAVYTEYIKWVNSFRNRSRASDTKEDSGNSTGEV